MDTGEREAVLSLVPYFNQNKRVVVDVGSNKGEWADILINNVDRIYLIEANIILLHHTVAKYDYLRNVVYRNKLLWSEEGHYKDFYVFKYNYNGLSSLFYNKEWEIYDHYKIQMITSTIEYETQYMQHTSKDIEVDEIIYTQQNIDFLKIDVEGAEYEVLKGAENLLKENKIKFIQIETGHQPTGQKITDLVNQYGYHVYRFNGKFEKAVIDDNQRENLYIMQEFTEDWNQEFIKNTQGMKFNFVLEIGCFEGLTTCYIADFLLNPNGRIICIDPLEDEYLSEDLSEEDIKQNKELTGFKGQYDRFIRNTKGKPVELKRKLSKDVFAEDGFNEFQFDFIYIDGDHREKSVYQDAIGAWKVLKQGGYMLFDDYIWSEGTKRGIDRFLKRYSRHYTMIINDYQIMIQRNVIE